MSHLNLYKIVIQDFKSFSSALPDVLPLVTYKNDNYDSNKSCNYCAQSDNYVVCNHIHNAIDIKTT